METRLTEWMECAICRLPSSTFFIACSNGHSFCGKCLSGLKECAMCRGKVITGQRVQDLSRHTAIHQCKQEFARGLHLHDEVDARDKDGQWYASRVIGMDSCDLWLVHFYGWSSHWDDWVGIDDLAPLHTYTTDWFFQIKTSEYVDYKRFGKWFWGRVQRIDPDQNVIHILSHKNKLVVVPLHPDLVAIHGLHTNPFKRLIPTRKLTPQPLPASNQRRTLST